LGFKPEVSNTVGTVVTMEAQPTTLMNPNHPVALAEAPPVTMVCPMVFSLDGTIMMISGPVVPSFVRVLPSTRTHTDNIKQSRHRLCARDGLVVYLFAMLSHRQVHVRRQQQFTRDPAGVFNSTAHQHATGSR
jgi:hypothetical protein